MILAAIIALGASGLILVLLAIAYPPIDDEASEPSAPTRERVPPRVIIRRDGVTPGLRHARPATEAREAVERGQKPGRLSALRKSWWRLRRGATDHGYPWTRLRAILATPDVRFVTGVLACSIAVGLLVVHLSV